VAGYTVANDYAIRDYLENWYRPNLRVKNRDTCTAHRPLAGRRGRRARPAWPALRTSVNGQVTQQGNTATWSTTCPR
jgi:5-oxopent-3-ene-1,2,5-tricarboxylate decarboxylase / 2-hydroxyhepta-2,4-diene-1,7-dioate isomerase